MTALGKGSAVVGLSRNGHVWTERPTGVVTLVHRTGPYDRLTFRVQWDGTCVEDDMFGDEIEAANVESVEEADYPPKQPRLLTKDQAQHQPRSKRNDHYQCIHRHRGGRS